MLSERALRRIVAEASTLGERISGVVVPVGNGADRERFERWRKLAARGSQRRFEEYLRRLGLDEGSARRILGRVRWKRGSPLPAWADTVRKLATFRFFPGKIACHEPGEIVPFEGIYLPIIAFARSELSARSVKYIAGLNRELLQRLSGICSQTLYLEFVVFRSVETRPALPATSGATVLYDEFVRHICRAGFGSFFREYPALARLIAVTVEHWLQSAADLSHRLRADRSLHGKTAQGMQAAAGLSDGHDGGKTVVILTRSDGSKFVYKPRDLAVEKAFTNLLLRLNAAELRPQLKGPEVIVRDGYGWMEFIPHLPCASKAAAQRFYRRAGALLGLVQALSGTDCHHENFVAGGEHPVLVDLETLLHFGPVGLRRRSPDEASLLRTGFLPIPREGKRGPYEFAALGGSLHATATALRWSFTNTDRMICERRAEAVAGKGNVVYRAARPVLAADYVSEIQAGYLDLQTLLRGPKGRAIWSAALEEFRHCAVRRIYRSTAEYLELAERSVHPHFLTCGLDRSIELEILRARRSLPAAVVEEEISALARMDVPRFSGPVDAACWKKLAARPAPTAQVCRAQADLIGAVLRPRASRY